MSGYVFELGGTHFSSFYDFVSLDFGTVPTVWYIFFYFTTHLNIKITVVWAIL